MEVHTAILEPHRMGCLLECLELRSRDKVSIPRMRRVNSGDLPTTPKTNHLDKTVGVS